MKVAVAVCVILAFAAQQGAAQDALAQPPPPPAVVAAPPPPVVAAPPPPVVAVPPPPPAVPAAVAPAPQAPPVTAAPAVQAPPPLTVAPVVPAAPAPKAVATPPIAPPVVTAAPAPQVVATPPVAPPVVTAAPAPQVVATPPVAPPVVPAAPAPKVVATPPAVPPTTVAPVIPAVPAPKAAAPAVPPTTAAPVAKAAPAPAPAGAVLPAVLPFPRAPTPAPAPAPVAPPRQCTNGAPRCQIFVEDALCCGNAQGLTTDSHYLTVDVLCTEYVVIPQGCLTVVPRLTNLSVYPAFQPAGVASPFHDYVVDFQKDNDFEAGPFVGRIDLTLEALRNVSAPTYNPTCALNIDPCLYNGTLYTNITRTNQVAITVLDTLDFVENYLGIPPTPTDTLGWAPNATNPAICQQADVGMLNATFYSGGFVNYTGYANTCNSTRTQLASYQFCEDYVLPFENRTLHNQPPSPPAPRVPGPALGPSSKLGIPL